MFTLIFYLIGIALGYSVIISRNILLTGLCLLAGALLLLFEGIIMLNKKWYIKYLKLTNKLRGKETDINPLIFKGRFLGIGIYLFLGIVLLYFSVLLILASKIQKTF